MVNIVVRHRVKDFNKWKPFFDGNEKERVEGGMISYKLLRGLDDPNLVIITGEWDNIENAKRFFQSGDLKKVMEQAGVIGIPDIQFLEKIAERAVAGIRA